MWALAATVGALMLPPVAARRLAVSSQLCSTAPARYAHAVRRVCFVVAHMLPPALGAGVSEVAARLPEPVAYHMLSGLAQLLLSFVAPLMVLARSEHRARLEFAAAHGDRAAVAGLVQWRERWQLSPLEWCLLTAAVLCLSLFAATFHTSYTPIPAEATSL